MEKLSFKLEPRHVVAYQYAVRRRVQHWPGAMGWRRELMIFLAIMVAGIVGSVLLDSAMHWLAGRPPSGLDLLLGFLAGLLFAMALQWLFYLVMRRNLLRPGGPTLAPHEVRLEADALTVAAPGIQNRTAWRAFEGVTDETAIVVLWLEPGLGLTVPDTAFAGPAERKAFVADVARRIAASATQQ